MIEHGLPRVQRNRGLLQDSGEGAMSAGGVGLRS